MFSATQNYYSDNVVQNFTVTFRRLYTVLSYRVLHVLQNTIPLPVGLMSSFRCLMHQILHSRVSICDGSVREQCFVPPLNGDASYFSSVIFYSIMDTHFIAHRPKLLKSFFSSSFRAWALVLHAS